MVCLSVCHSRKPCKSCSIDHDAIEDVDSGEPKEPCIMSHSYFLMLSFFIEVNCCNDFCYKMIKVAHVF